MELLAAVDDHTVQEVCVSARLAGVSVSVAHVEQAALQQMHPLAMSLLLKCKQGYIAQHHAMLRYIAELAPEAYLYGRSEFEQAQVDKWLDYSWLELEVVLQAVIDTSVSSAAAEEILPPALKVLDDQLCSSTYLTGNHITIADVAVGCTCVTMWRTLPSLVSNSYPNLYRWLMTFATIPAVRQVIGEAMLPATVTPATVPTVGVGSHPAPSGTNSEPMPTGRFNRRRIRVKELLAEGSAAVQKYVVLKGWVKTTRQGAKGSLSFVELNDGSSAKSVQLVLSKDTTEGFDASLHSGGVGASLSVSGTVVASQGKGQEIEVQVDSVQVLGAVYAGDNGEIGGKNYPLSKKAHGAEYLRKIAHLRPRTVLFSCALRVRHAMAYATHKFFHERGFLYVHTPIITAADCEGAGEQFAVTSMLKDGGKLSDVPSLKSGEVDYSKDFFGRRACLTVSGQLNVETHACALSDVYTFGPTFRAEDSHTSRHLAEFWMIEPEVCFADIHDDIDLAEDYLKFCVQYALEQCPDDLEFFETDSTWGEPGLRDRLRNVLNNDFVRITYTQGIELLQQCISEGKVEFEVYPTWGCDLGSEHERYITEQVYKMPVVIVNYPKEIKAFYMRLNDNNKTVAAMDVLVPRIGEIIGGSQREERYDVLLQRCAEMNLSPESLYWYIDLRRYGTVPHAGFGLGFERLIMFVTGLENIRDVIPFPRAPGLCDF